MSKIETLSKKTINETMKKYKENNIDFTRFEPLVPMSMITQIQFQLTQVTAERDDLLITVDGQAEELQSLYEDMAGIDIQGGS